MIIFDDLSIQTRSDVPDADWTGGLARYVVDDNSALAEKILANPFFEPVEDADGRLIDVLPAAHEPLLRTLDEHIAEIKAELTTLDAQSIRPLRAIASGNGDGNDTDALEEIEERARALRAELQELGADAADEK